MKALASTEPQTFSTLSWLSTQKHLKMLSRRGYGEGRSTNKLYASPSNIINISWSSPSLSRLSCPWPWEELLISLSLPCCDGRWWSLSMSSTAGALVVEETSSSSFCSPSFYSLTKAIAPFKYCSNVSISTSFCFPVHRARPEINNTEMKCL